MALDKALLEWKIATDLTVDNPDLFTGIGIKGMAFGNHEFGVFMNLALNHQNLVQLRFDVDGNKNVLGFYLRGWHNVNGWQDWKTIARF